LTPRRVSCIYSYMHPFSPPLNRVRIPPPGGAPPRVHPKQAHPPAVVDVVRALIETTSLTHRDIAARAGVDTGTVSRWREKYGWTRPRGAWPATGRPEKRFVPVVIGRALATRLRIQAERLVAEIEGAEKVDAAALAEALRLLVEARHEQAVRRTRKRMPRPPPSPEALAAAAQAAAEDKEREAERDRILARHGRGRWPRDRRAAALKGWSRRYARARRHEWRGVDGSSSNSIELGGCPDRRLPVLLPWIAINRRTTAGGCAQSVIVRLRAQMHRRCHAPGTRLGASGDC
jgi:hypothetical protein